MGCCCCRKKTHAQKAANSFYEYSSSLAAGIILSIVALGCSAAVLRMSPHNAAMIWHVCLSIFTGITFFILCANCNRHFNVVNKLPRDLSTPKGSVATLTLVLLLWITAFVALFVDWPTNPSGWEITKRYDVDISEPIQNGAIWGCFGSDLTFITGTLQAFYALWRALYHAKRVDEEVRSSVHV